MRQARVAPGRGGARRAMLSLALLPPTLAREPSGRRKATWAAVGTLAAAVADVAASSAAVLGGALLAFALAGFVAAGVGLPKDAAAAAFGVASSAAVLVSVSAPLRAFSGVFVFAAAAAAARARRSCWRPGEREVKEACEALGAAAEGGRGKRAAAHRIAEQLQLERVHPQRLLHGACELRSAGCRGHCGQHPPLGGRHEAAARARLLVRD